MPPKHSATLSTGPWLVFRIQRETFADWRYLIVEQSLLATVVSLSNCPSPEFDRYQATCHGWRGAGRLMTFYMYPKLLFSATKKRGIVTVFSKIVMPGTPPTFLHRRLALEAGLPTILRLHAGKTKHARFDPYLMI